ncbi:MAG TPA: hypothetical protein VMY35_10930 [Phycisphaerae bacterium]|nr:hypothetical protein [Phycisphaerae bacterium]
MKHRTRLPADDDDPEIAFADRVAVAFRSTALTHDEIGKQMGGIPAHELRELVRGESGRVSLTLIAALAKWSVAHGCSLDWLFAGVGHSRDSHRGSIPPSPDRMALCLQDRLLLAIARKVGVDV